MPLSTTILACVVSALVGGVAVWLIVLRHHRARKMVERRWKRVVNSLLRETGRLSEANGLSVRSMDYDQLGREAWSQIQQDLRRLHAIHSAMSEGLALIDSNRQVLFCNPAFISMFRTSEGETLAAKSFAPEDGPAIIRRLEDARAESRVASLEARLSTTPRRDVLVMVKPYSDDQIQRGLALTAIDITKRRQADQLRSEFVANVSHELRTPLAAIRGYVDTCLEPVGKDEQPPYQRFLPIIDQHAQRLHALIEDLLILSRIESKAVHLQIQPMQLADVVDDAISTLLNESSKKDVTIINAVPPMLPDVNADARAVERILINLIENAIKYSEPGSEIRVTARVQHEMIYVMIEDEGIGIPAEHQERIFERFYRVDKARSRKAGGTGLGLSIVKHLVLSLAGEVWVDSEPGRGSTFFFTLPIAHAPRRGESPADVENPAEVNG